MISLTMKDNKAFTLIELLLAITIFAVIAPLAYSVLFQGIKLWKQNKLLQNESVEKRVILEKMSSDFRQSFIHDWVNFMGSSNQIYFCKIENNELRKIQYTIYQENSKSKPILLRLNQSITAPIEESPNLKNKITDIFHKLSFSYGYWDIENEQIIEYSEWINKESLPRIIFLKGEIDGKPFQKNFLHPMGILGDSSTFEENKDDRSN